jgi:hypothetical protein
MGGFFEMLWSKVMDLLEAIRDLFANLLQDFKDSNRYFKLKAGMIAGYVLVGLVTVLVFVPPGELNEINARLRVSKTEIIGGRYFLVVNQGKAVWKDVHLKLNNTYDARWPVLRPGRKKAFFFSQFQDARGVPPAEDLGVQRLRIDCSAGAFERDFTRQ